MKVKVGDVVVCPVRGPLLVIEAIPSPGILAPAVTLQSRAGLLLYVQSWDAHSLEPDPELTRIEAMKTAGRLGF